MIIDAHNHPDWLGHDLSRFLENMEQHHIDKTWLLTWECPETEWAPFYRRTVSICEVKGPISFEKCLQYKERAPEKFVLGYAPDPRRPGAIADLQAAIDIHGCRVCGELKLRMMFDNPDAIRMYRFCGEKGLPVIVHIDYEIEQVQKRPWPNWWYGGGIEPFARAAKACPETVFLGHGPGFWAHISNDDQYDKESYPKGAVVPGGRVETLLRECPNVYCDISAGSGRAALERDKEYSKLLITEFSDRFLYARDCFDNQHQELIEELDLSDAVKQKLLHGNAARLTGEEA